MEAFLLRFVVLVAATPSVLTSPYPPSPSPAFPASRSTALFVLGDSSVNSGDNSVMNLFLPHNLSSSRLFSSSRRRLLPDFIAQKMGLPPPLAFYSRNWTLESLATGVNFGSTPATILSATTAANSPVGAAASELLLLQTLNQQVRQVYETLQLLHLEIGPAAGRRVQSSLFILSFGRDDYTDIISKGTATYPMYGRRGLARLLVSQMIQAVKGLYNAGARRIAVMGVGPLGCTPHVRWKASHALQGNQCVQEANEMVEGYNTRLAARLGELEQELPSARVVFCDVYRGMMEIISNSEIYGFKNARDACCGAGFYRGLMGCWAKGMACGDPSVHVWWDLYGATEAVEALLANWSWSHFSADRQICTPLNLQQLASL